YVNEELSEVWNSESHRNETPQNGYGKHETVIAPS
ncbi:unnamed protein product, partial [Allacma fusca]